MEKGTICSVTFTHHSIFLMPLFVVLSNKYFHLSLGMGLSKSDEKLLEIAVSSALEDVHHLLDGPQRLEGIALDFATLVCEGMLCVVLFPYFYLFIFICF